MENRSRKNSFVKKFMSVFLSLTLMVGVVSASGLTASAEDSNQDITDTATGLVYSIDGNNATISWFHPPVGFNGNLVIPETLGGKTVNQISCDFWDDCDIASVTVPSSVTSILIDDSSVSDSKLTAITVDSGNPSYSSRDGVLYSKDGKTLLDYPIAKPGEINIPTDVTSIGDYAFIRNKQLSITVPGNVKTIGMHAFIYSDIENVTLAEGVQTINAQAFFVSGLTKITIPSSLSSIGDEVFTNCDKLENIAVAPTNPTYSSIDGALYSKDGKTLLRYPNSKSGQASIANTTTSIADHAFDGCFHLESVVFPSGLSSIGNDVFYNCPNITSVVFNSNVNTIGTGLFGFAHMGDIDPINIKCTIPFGTKKHYEDLMNASSGGQWDAVVVNLVESPAPAGTATPASSAQATATSSAPATIKDSASGATVVGVNGTVLGANTTLSVTPITDAQKMQKASGFLITAAGKNAALAGMQLEALYQINLNQNGVTIEPNGKVRVTMSLPASLKGLKNLNMVRFNDDGTVTLMNAVSDGTTITFETDHFSTYGIVETQPAAAKPATKNSATGDSSPVMPLAILTFAAASAFVLIASKKKH